jgi:hypothetical protein
MTIATTIPRDDYNGDDLQVDFTINFEFKSEADIKVFTYDTGTGIEAELLTGWSVAGTPKADGTGFSGGTVTFTVAPTATTDITLINDAATTQPTSFTAGNDFPEVDVEGSLDRLAILIQEAMEMLNRSPKWRVTRTDAAPEFPDPDAGKLIAWNAAADGLENVINAAASGAGTTVAVSSNDSTPGFLLGKLVAGTNITLVEGNDGGDEIITVNATATPATTSPFEVEESGATAAIIRGFRSDAADATSVPLVEFSGHGKNQAGAQIEFGRIIIQRGTNGHATGLEDGEIIMFTRRDGVLDASPRRFRLAQGLTIDDPDEAAALADKGPGAINCRSFFIDDEPFESSAITPQLTAIAVAGSTALDTLTTARQLAGFGTIAGTLYAAGGEDAGGNALATTEKYTIATDTWAAGVNIPTAVRQPASALHDSKLYVIGGADTGGTPQAKVQELTPGAPDTWDDTLSVAGYTARRQAVAAISGDDLIVLGGINAGAAVVTTVERYRPPGATAAPDTWATLAVLPAARTNGCAAVLGDGFLYYFGGSSTVADSGAQSDIYTYDITNDVWLTAGVKLPRVLVAPTCIVLSGYAIIIGGTEGARGRTTSAWLFDPFRQTFLHLGDLTTGRAGAIAGLNTDNDIIIAGGLTATVQDTTIRFAGTASQLSQGVGFRSTSTLTEGALLNITAGIAERNVTVRLGDSWRVLPYSDSDTTVNVAFVGDSVLNGNLLATKSGTTDIFELTIDADTVFQWDSTNKILYLNGEPINELLP